MPNSKTKLIGLLTAASFLAFFIFGFTDNLKGSTIPEVLKDLDLNYSQGGTILLGVYLGFLIATLLMGFLADRAGKKSVILVACVCLLIGLAGYSTFRSYIPLIVAMLFLGLGLGSIELGANAIIVDLHAQNKGRYLNLMAVFHGLGSTIAPIYASQLIQAAVSWQPVYRWDMIPVAILFLCFMMLPYPRQEGTPGAPIVRKGIWNVAFTGQMIGFYILIAASVCAELGIASWIVEFLQKTKSQSIESSNLALSLFFGMMVIGRLAGSLFVEWLGYLKSVVLASIGGAVCLVLGVFGPPALAFFLPLEGLFQSITFPTITAAVSDRHHENQGTILGLLFTFAGVGGMLGPWLVGVASDAFTIRYGFGLVLMYCIIMGISAFVLMKGARDGS
jgi:FHS family glucose/mannose:H+ symporter-like MFS transporter